MIFTSTAINQNRINSYLYLIDKNAIKKLKKVIDIYIKTNEWEMSCSQFNDEGKLSYTSSINLVLLNPLF